MKVRHWFELNLMRLYYWTQLWSARESRKLAISAVRLLDAEIRLLRFDLLQLGEKTCTDNLVRCVSCRLLQQEYDGDEIAPHSTADVDELLNLAQASERIQTCLTNFYLAYAFLAELVGDKAKLQDRLASAKKVNASAAPLKIIDITAQKKQFEKRLAQAKQKLAERSAFRIEVTVSDISNWIALVTALLFLAGFLHTRFFFGYFGIDVSFFFGLSDYLAASIEQVTKGAFAAVLGLVIFALGARSASLKPRLIIEMNASQRSREEFAVRLMTLCIALAAGYSIWTDRPNFGAIQTAATLSSLIVAEWIADRFFQKPLPWTASLAATFAFFSTVAISGYRNVLEITAGDRGPYSVQVADAVIDVKAARLFGMNNNFAFFYSNSKKAVIVVPRDKILTVSRTVSSLSK